MYRTKSFLSELSFERNGGGDGYSGDGAGGVEKRGEYFAAMNFQQDPEMERQIVRKLDRHLLPLLGILYLFSYLDRVNIGNARLFGLEEAVHLSNGQYNIALASFFLAYCLFELPSNWMLVRLGPRIWIPLLMFLWGGVSLALAWVTNFTGLVVARFALGTAEAGFVPGVLFYLTLFYKRSEHSFRMAIFLCFNILAGAFGGLLAAGISQLAGKWNLQGWQWIFILEAIPTLLLAVLTWFIMTPSPMEAKFLTEEERIYATNRIIVDSDVVPTVEASWRQTRSALTDVRVYLICLGSMLLHLPSAGVVMFLPSLIADMGFKATTAQLLTVPPYMVAACISLLVPWWSDRLGIRGYFAIFIPMVSLVGFSLLAFAPWTWLRYLAVTFALCGMVPTSSILTSWLTNNCIGHAKRATALAMMISAGSLAGMAGTQVYRPDDAPRYQRGHIVMAISICCFILNALVLRTMLSRENHRRDNNQTKGLRLLQFMSEGHLNDLGDMHPNFRYTL
ncbi:major facilitator superfamily domain-containing protein [Linnemannia elongata]|nr:major facilitator superfamily domain-containing protein [Linnemannia elongata]